MIQKDPKQSIEIKIKRKRNEKEKKNVASLASYLFYGSKKLKKL